MNDDALAVCTAHVTQAWRDEIIPELHDYIAIPALSPAFDADWATTGMLAKAVDQITTWARRRKIAGLTIDVVTLPGRTPTMVFEIPAFNLSTNDDDDVVVLYGHYDKQPEMSGWRGDLGPWTPVRDGDRLYGRGGADDGYSAFGALTAIEALQAAGGSHSRCFVLIEGSEESGSVDLPAYVDVLAERLGTPSLVIALDSSCLSYDRLWVTTSLRGIVGATVTVEVLTEGKHSGAVSGIVPSSFRIMRQLLDRVEDAATGVVLVPELHTEIPAQRVDDARATAAEFPHATGQPFAGGTRPVHGDPAEQRLNATWRPTLSVIGADGLPPTNRAGNVLRPSTTLKLSFRIPPRVDPERGRQALIDRLLADPPYDAVVRIDHSEAAPGWDAPEAEPWLRNALDTASQRHFGRPAAYIGEGGTIPFMGMLGEKFPGAQFVITGVLGPDSNAHGPNEYIHLPTAERVTAAVATLLDLHARRHDATNAVR
ncbi:MAG: M20/M25/M40 family metallo-hydrolase [Acidimicrobiia bacterium]